MGAYTTRAGGRGCGCVRGCGVGGACTCGAARSSCVRKLTRAGFFLFRPRPLPSHPVFAHRPTTPQVRSLAGGRAAVYGVHATRRGGGGGDAAGRVRLVAARRASRHRECSSPPAPDRRPLHPPRLHGRRCHPTPRAPPPWRCTHGSPQRRAAVVRVRRARARPARLLCPTTALPHIPRLTAPFPCPPPIRPRPHRRMTRRTKKVGITGKYGTRYGASLRKLVKKIEMTQRAKVSSPPCGARVLAPAVGSGRLAAGQRLNCSWVAGHARMCWTTLRCCVWRRGCTWRAPSAVRVGRCPLDATAGRGRRRVLRSAVAALSTALLAVLPRCVCYVRSGGHHAVRHVQPRLASNALLPSGALLLLLPPRGYGKAWRRSGRCVHRHGIGEVALPACAPLRLTTPRPLMPTPLPPLPPAVHVRLLRQGRREAHGGGHLALLRVQEDPDRRRVPAGVSACLQCRSL